MNGHKIILGVIPHFTFAKVTKKEVILVSLENTFGVFDFFEECF